MPTTELAPRPLEDDVADNDVAHLTCCEDEDIALCGCDLTDATEVPATYDGARCQTCFRLREQVLSGCACPVRALRSLR